MTVRPLTDDDGARWLEMRAALWPDGDAAAPGDGFVDLAEGKMAAFGWDADGTLVGFAEVSVRSHADGAAHRPVGYLEAWWVDPDHRGIGIGRALVTACEAWVRDQGCREMASDATIGNELGRAAHGALGFDLVDEVAQFVRVIPATEATPTIDPEAGVSLRPLTEDNVRAVCRLEPAMHQRSFVAPNAISIAQAHVTTKVWVRVIYAGETPVGYLQLSDDDEQPRYYLWRFMVDGAFQGRGYGRRAMELLFEYVRGRPGGDRLYLSYVRAPGGPEAFYKSLGFVDTGRVHSGEHEAMVEF